jgi:L-ribulose-5-phosphate 3-epimerase
MHCLDQITLGIYEKAFPSVISWPERLGAAAAAGYDFVEISIDETEARLSRLDWNEQQRAELRRVVADTGIPLISLCLSAQRRFPMGSASPEIRQKSLDIVHKAIHLAHDLGVRMVLVPGYDVFYEPSTPASQDRFLTGLHQAVHWASRAGVLLGLENSDVSVTSITQALAFVHQLNSPWLQVYGDIGNLNALGLDVVAELEAGAGHLAGIHVKDTTAGEFRHIPLGQGTVPFVAAFRTLWKIGFSGPIMLEMWGDEAADALQTVTASRQWLLARLQESWLDLAPHAPA